MPLNHQQTYLLNRLPSRYSYHPDEEPEPARIQAARKMIEAWDTRQTTQAKDLEKKYNQALNAVREAIYFKPPGDALKVVKDFEEKFGLVPKS